MSRALRVALSIALLVAVVAYAGGPAVILDPMLSADPLWVIASLVVATLDRALMVAKWSYLLRSQGESLPLCAGLKIYCSAMLHGMVLPSTMGADAIRIYQTQRRGLRTQTVVASVVVERLTGFIASLAVGLAGFWILDLGGYLDARFANLGRVGAFVLTLAGGMFALSLSPRFFETLETALPDRVAQSVLARRISSMLRSYTRFGASRNVLVSFFALTVLEQLVTIVYCWLTALAVGVEVSLGFIAGVLPLTLLVSRLPISLDGLGVFEAIFIALMGLGGVSAAEATAVALIGRILQTISWLPWSVAQSLDRSSAPAVRDRALPERGADPGP